MYVAIAGNIGSGKTTLAGLLSKHYGWKVQYEDTEDDNPYLYDFYSDMQRWSFHLQVYFLGRRFKQIVELQKSKADVVQDRTIFEDARIFAANLHAMQLMSDSDYTTYVDLFELMNSLIAPPDLLIYIRASVPTLVRQIQRRGREYEEGIRLDYLKNLNDRYEDFIKSYRYPKLIIDVDEINFSDNPKDLSEVINRVDAVINGLF
ncbi:MAG: deoxynucleoside kinase [Prevotellaceae bacterium]|jgi:deoxyadenosine/deoxycytidine kinase|nr:deoxynucleoside kinase [Prevotellaceae bacterium]